MKRILLTLLVATAIFNTATAQQKLTLEEAVIGQYRQFAPATLDQLNWLGQSDQYVFAKENTMWVGSLKAKTADSKLFTLDELNAWLGGAALKALPQVQWLDADHFFFDNGSAYIEVDLKAKKGTTYCGYTDKIENLDYHAKSHHLAGTVENNLVVIAGGQEKKVTENAKDIVSGQTVSRSEYGITKGTFWSPDGSKLAFYQKDESNVTNYPLINYNTVPATVREIKYPMAGGKSEWISVGVYDMATSKTIFLKLDGGKPNDQFYATNLSWSPDNKVVYIAWLNRATTDMKFIAFDVLTGAEIKVLFTEHDDTWVEPLFPATFIPGQNEKFIWMSERDGFTNLYLYDTKGTSLGKTTANFEITELLGFDSKNEYAFVMATGEFPTESLCYRVKLSDMTMQKVSQFHGVHNVKISGSGIYVIDQHSNITTPNKIDITSNEGRLVKNLINAPNPYEGKSIGKVELFSIPAADGTDLWCRMVKPSNFDDKKKYPVLVYVYGGPHAQMVTNSFLGGASLWMNQFAEEGYIVFTLDNRGSGNRGKKFQHVIHRQLGNAEIEDQMIGVEWLKKQPYINSEKMAVHGWSFGGFMTSSLMLRKPEVFKVGVAGGPVIDWSMYEVMYGERYMDTPQENPEGYKNADVTGYLQNLKGSLLMIHGMDDDVVVMQHNVKFLKASVDKKVQVDFFAYPGHQHNVRGKDRVHLMTKVLGYIKEKLD